MSDSDEKQMAEATTNIMDPVARVEINTLKSDVNSISRDIHSLRQNMATKDDFSALRIAIEKADQDRRPQWQAYGVMLTALLAIGALAWWPFREQQSDFKDSIRELSRGVVFQRQYEDNQKSLAKIINRIDAGKANKETQDAVNRDQDRRMDGLAGRIREMERKFEVKSTRAATGE